MNLRDFTKSFMAGLFFIVGVLLIVGFVFTLGKDKGLAKAKFQIPVLFNNVGGLSEGAPARLAGVTVGGVSSIDFLQKPVEGRRVVVTISVLDKYRPQFDNSVKFAIVTEGVLGEKLMEIKILDGGDKLNLSQPIFGEDPLEVSDLVEVFTSAADSFTKTAEEISQIDMVELSTVMRDSSKALLITADGLNAMMDELYDITRKSKRIFDRIEQKVIEGDLFKVF